MLSGMDFEAVKASMPTLVPMVGTLDLEFLELDERTAVLRLPDQKAYHNHIGGPHAGAMFTLGTRIEGRPVYELHHPKFDLDERALPVGTAVLAETALRFLRS